VWNPFNLEGKTAIVTGAGQGLGYAIAMTLGRAGANVVVADMIHERARNSVDDMRRQEIRAMDVNIDVTDEDGVETLVNRSVNEYGEINILVNNAGTSLHSRFEELSMEVWNKVIGINLTGVFLCTKFVGRQMIKQGKGGRIINIASMSGLVANKGVNNAHYCASKAGVIGLTRSLAIQWIKYGILVNAIAPGYFSTPLTTGLRQDVVRYEEIVQTIPMGRFGEPEELGTAVLFLSADSTSYMTGQTLIVDGGYTCW